MIHNFYPSQNRTLGSNKQLHVEKFRGFSYVSGILARYRIIGGVGRLCFLLERKRGSCGDDVRRGGSVRVNVDAASWLIFGPRINDLVVKC